ncbi:MAG: antibiotic biosynthesis monooxygenase [Rhodobacteraceae bacterium]|nr:antibiotic biosynthesis monooxygenase [Paracoccaceae bacterium]
MNPMDLRAAENWMRFCWGAPNPFDPASGAQFGQHWARAASAMLPPPWGYAAHAAIAWRDMLNSGHASALAEADKRAAQARVNDAAATGLKLVQPSASSSATGDATAMTAPPSEPAPQPKPANVVLINTFVVPIAMEESFLSWWRLMKPAFASQRGFVSAKLHRSLDQNERYRFINIAEWESTEAYRRALTGLWSSVPKPTIAGMEWHPALYEVVESA